jgi:hypothetical protein
MSLRLVDVATACVALHQSARSRGYKLLREGADPKSLWWYVILSFCLVNCVSIALFPRWAPCLPFYSSQGEDSGYNCGKKVKGENERENKKVASGVAVFLLIYVSILPCSTGTQWASSFWPPRPLVQRVVAML